MTSPEAEECRQLLAHYDTALTHRIDGHHSKQVAKDLVALDSWRVNELPKSVQKRTPAHMTKGELEKLMECKLYFEIHRRFF